MIPGGFILKIGMPAKKIKLYYSIGEAAGYLGVSIQTLRRWSKSGKISYIRTKGRFRRFPHDELLKIRKYGPNILSVLSSKQAGQELGVSFPTLKRWTKLGKINFFKVANRFFFPREEIEESEHSHSEEFFRNRHSPFNYLLLVLTFLSFFIFLYLLNQLTGATQVAGIASNISRPVSGALTTFLAPFSPQLASQLLSRLRPADKLFAESRELTGQRVIESVVFGQSGETGPTGSVGEIGIQGNSGDKGVSGKAGSDGSAGSNGQTGPTGSTGMSGSAGPTGTT